MNVLSLLQPTGRDSGCSLLTPFTGRLGCHPPSAEGFFHTTMAREMCFSQQVCSSSARPAHIGNGNFSISQHTGWPCRLFSSSSLDMAEAPASLLCFSTMPCQWVQDWYSHWSINLPLHCILFPCPSCVCVTQCMNSVPLRKPLGSGGRQ